MLKGLERLQAEMGIKPTNFDSNILDENTALLIDQSYRKSPTQLNEIQDGEQPTIESEEMDYEQIMAAPTTNSGNRPSPRQEIFTTHLSRDNSCPSPAFQPHANSCYFGPPKPADQSQEHVKEIKTIYKKQRQAPPTNQDNFAVSGPEIPLQFQTQTDLQSNQSFEASLVFISLPKIHPIRYIKTNLARLTPR